MCGAPTAVKMATLFQRTVAAEAAVTTLAAEVERLQLENSVFQKFYEKKSMELGADEDTKGKKKKNKVAAKLLTVEQRVDVANVVHEDLLGEIESNRKNSEKMIDTLRAVLE